MSGQADAAPRRIGIYGGTFNPIHNGHLSAARAMTKALALDLLLLMPAAEPPHKALAKGSPEPGQRLELVRLGADSLRLPQLGVSERELRRQGKSYTVDTLRELAAAYPGAELWLLMGTDMFLSFQDWRAPEEILRLAGLCAFGREAADVRAVLETQKAALEARFPGARIRVEQNPDVVEVSSTALRESLARGEGEEFLPPAVYGCILREGLYGTCADLRALKPEQLRPVALSFLRAKRIPHVLGTEETALRLAARAGADREKARTAALLHDCTKRLDMEEQLALCTLYGIGTDPLERSALKLLHAKTGAAVAGDLFGADAEVVGAIRWHTTGRPDMTPLEKIIYLADYIEPTRSFPGVEELRRACERNLDEGLELGLAMTVEEMRALGEPVHENTLNALAFLKGTYNGDKG